MILDSTAVKSLYSSEDPVGTVIDINGEPFTVVGVVTEVNSFEPVINSEEDYWTYMGNSGGKMFIPNQSWPIAYQYDEPENCLAKAVDTDSMPAVGKKVAELMNATIRTTSAGGEDDSSQVKYDSQDSAETGEVPAKAQLFHQYHADLDRQHFPAGRRHRRYEHHAGICNRAYP